MQSVVGMTCPFCQAPIKPGDSPTICSECGIPHHDECWTQNGGCTTFGCAGHAAIRAAEAGMAAADNDIDQIRNEHLPDQTASGWAKASARETTVAILLACGVITTTWIMYLVARTYVP